ncbi:MAG: D-aminoacylase [Armatimonadota bacterium]|nr:D-aminoacylase [Armatimonadota bacterium]MDR7451374.1 D-aminoacylase [Armatimonadota bacterium]MDR7466476.1 D-aminoacylase [Armatimonadota bacterium]MDR7493198.1 D-aminoacylase [Armatimonadota bacterium]MDR7499449.1 D-aminoacylase [Armatimonadota bacterium]
MFDLIIRDALVYDGSGSPPFVGDLALRGDRLAAVGPHLGGPTHADLDARGLAAAPGFINMLSWANASLLIDGRSQSDLRQGVTLEVLGEGVSMGPLTEAMAREMSERQGDLRYAVTWTTLGGYLDHLAAQGVSCNVASFVGATTARIYVLGYENRPPTAVELDRMRAVVDEAMAEGAVGVSSALIYPPATYSDTAELIALAACAAEAGGLYISHLRNEGARIDEALDEFFTVLDTSGARGEIYHLKVSGRAHWHRMAGVLERIEAERAQGVEVTADVYPYTASSTGLDTAIPPWAHEGGEAALLARLRDPTIRRRLRQEMALFADPSEILVVGFKQARLKPLTGRTLADVAAERRTGWQDAVMDLIVENDGDVGAVFFTMSEDNVRAVMARPWVSFCSDAGSYAAEGVFLSVGTHPRAYGAFARVLGKYVREERLLTLEEAVRRLTSLPATVLRLTDRGRLAPGYVADLVLFDPATIADRATYERPHQYATGVRHVFVNGVPVIRDGEHTGATPGRVVRGPGWRGR